MTKKTATKKPSIHSINPVDRIDALSKVGRDTLRALSKGGYIKGYSDQRKRVMDKEHHALFNITFKVFEELKFNYFIKVSGLTYVIDDKFANIEF